jgi:alkanesulfonate monooxygenase SsuD/methylene tetrahydromethanopterin reductase-like flavin-dependent oxidoreductase (luciferase family)
VTDVRVGLPLPSFVQDPAIPLAVATAAEDAGLDGVFVYDHLFRRAADGTRRPALEGVALLGSVAAATDAIHVGALVFRAWLRPAASLAAAVETTARIAPGRVIAAIGAGDSQSREENETFGLGFGTMSDRVARLDAAVRASSGLGARVWVGGEAPAVLDVAATSAAGWNAWGASVDHFARQTAGLRAVAVYGDFECSWGGLAVLAATDEDARDKAERLGASKGAIVGSPATVTSRLHEFVEAGADWLIVAPVDSRDPANAELLADVRSRLRG